MIQLAFQIVLWLCWNLLKHQHEYEAEPQEQAHTLLVCRCPRKHTGHGPVPTLPANTNTLLEPPPPLPTSPCQCFQLPLYLPNYVLHHEIVHIISTFKVTDDMVVPGSNSLFLFRMQ